ncbi:MAG: Crp/Fnr family transcriptional regulator [Nitrospirae bacterium]|nr:Crp/Fnr family transcriptional regulator [Nitrospirota bacterium]
MKKEICVRGDDKELIEKFLKRISLFRNFNTRSLQCVLGEFKVITVENNEDVVFQDDEGTDLYIVLKGKVKVSLTGLDGNEFILTELKEGDFFGEMSLIDGKSRSANVIALEDTTLGVLPRDMFICTMKENNAIAFDLLEALIQRLRKSNDMIESLAFLDVNERLVKFLIDDARKHRETVKGSHYIARKRTHQEMASHIGVSREAVTKALKALSFRKTVIEEDGYFLISSDAASEFSVDK